MPIRHKTAMDTAAEAAESGEGALHSTMTDLRERTPQMLGKAAAQVEELTRRSIERARDAGYQVRDRVERAGDMTVGYIRDEPMKSVLVAAAAGAAVALFLGWLARSAYRHR